MSDAEPRERLPDLVERAEETLESLGDEDGEDGDGDALEDLRELYEVAEEAADLLEDVDLSELPDAVDGDDLVEAIEVGEIPQAIEDGDAKEAVDLRALMHAINFRKLASSANLTDLWSDADELSDAIDDVGDDGDDGGGLADAVPGVGGDDEGEDDDLFDTDLGGGDMEMGDVPDEAYQVTIQEKAMEAVDEFREGVMEAHDKLKRLREVNREKMRRNHEEKGISSRNPTAHSTVQIGRGDIEGVTGQHSTVPDRPKYSTAPTRTRIYGNRFETFRDTAAGPQSAAESEAVEDSDAAEADAEGGDSS